MKVEVPAIVARVFKTGTPRLVTQQKNRKIIKLANCVVTVGKLSYH